MRTTRHKITFTTQTQQLAGALGQCGQGNWLIKRNADLSDGQISYLLAKLQRLQGRKGGYRRAWSRGESYLWKRFGPIMLRIAMARIKQTIPPKLARPLPQFTRGKERRAPTVDEAVAILKRNKAGLP